jgi:hypothetical protein
MFDGPQYRAMKALDAYSELVDDIIRAVGKRNDYSYGLNAILDEIEEITSRRKAIDSEL